VQTTGYVLGEYFEINKAMEFKKKSEFLGMAADYAAFSRADFVGSFPDGIEFYNKFNEMGHDQQS
jgi:hypothetical protein